MDRLRGCQIIYTIHNDILFIDLSTMLDNNVHSLIGKLVMIQSKEDYQFGHPTILRSVIAVLNIIFPLFGFFSNCIKHSNNLFKIAWLFHCSHSLALTIRKECVFKIYLKHNYNDFLSRSGIKKLSEAKAIIISVPTWCTNL